MALGNIGRFLPSETAYKDPNRFRDVLRAEGNQRAAYLSSMDQFYAQLDETTRQFNETLGFKREELSSQERYQEGQLELGREQLGENSDQWRAELEALRSYRDRSLDLSAAQLTEQGREFDQEFSLEDRKLQLTEEELALEKEESDFLRPFYLKELGYSGVGKTTSSPSSLSSLPSYYTPGGKESPMDWFKKVGA